MIDGNKLILVKGDYDICPVLEAFESVEGWGQLWGFHDCFVIEDAGWDLLSEVLAVQVPNSEHRFFRLKLKINVT